jgi:hypothetical protein
MIPRRVAAAWDRIHRTHPEPEPPTPPAPTLAQQRLERLHRVTRVALNFDTLLHLNDGEAVACDLEEFDREFLYHLYTADNAAQLFVQAAEQLEVQP